MGSLSPFLLSKSLIINLLLNLLCFTSKSLKCSSYFQRPPIFFSMLTVNNPSQVASIHMSLISICHLPFSTFGCLSQKHPVNQFIIFLYFLNLFVFFMICPFEGIFLIYMKKSIQLQLKISLTLNHFFTLYLTLNQIKID